MAHVLMVDEDQRLIKVYANHLLEAGHTVTVRYGSVEADTFLREALSNHRPPDAVTMGIMMSPYGLFTPEETDDGLRTGASFFHRMRAAHNYFGPVVVLTNVAHEVVRSSFEAVGCVYAVKEETYPPKLVDIIEQCTRPKNPVSFLHQAFLRWRNGRPGFAVRKPDISLPNADRRRIEDLIPSLEV
ncbi:MAG: response regulator [Nanoarchaeota archaeon]